MISGHNFYNIMTAMVPLYVAMILAYGSVKWWKIFTPDQCSGINRFVAMFAVPLLSFHFVARNNPYTMNWLFIAADTLQKIFVLAALAVWANASKRGSLEWSITLFSITTLPNTLVMGIPLLKGMYGDYPASLMVQIVVLQCIVWYTLLLFMFEYRGAKMLISEQFPDTAGSIVSIHVDSDVVSLDRRHPLETEVEVKEDGKLHVTVRKSNVSRSDVYSRRSMGYSSNTLRPSNLTNEEICSVQSSRIPTPRGSSFNHTDFYSMMGGGGSDGGGRNSNFGVNDAYALPGSRRPSNFEEESGNAGSKTRFYHGGSNNNAHYPAPNPGMFSPSSKGNIAGKKEKEGGKDLHMFVWSTSASPISDVFGGGGGGGYDHGSVEQQGKDVRVAVSPTKVEGQRENNQEEFLEREDFNFANGENGGENKAKVMPPTSVMTRLILIMVWRKLMRNPNTYSSIIGLIWSLVSYRWHVEMPAIVAKSIAILSDAGLGMAMFSLGLFMALQPRIIACGNFKAAFTMAVKFLAGPAVMAAASAVVGIRGRLLRTAIVQAALPQGLVPFVYAKEYSVHADILSTGVIFGMLVAVPITIIYYILLEL